MNKQIFAFDFSMNKPAMCSLINDKLEFFVWPSNIDDKSQERLNNCNIHVINRNIPAAKNQGLNEHKLILEHIKRSVNLANIIADQIETSLFDNNIKSKDDVVISNEGFAFSAKGDAILDLSGYKYILMYILYQRGFKTFLTYSPITIKMNAGCSKRGLGKDAMICAVGTQNENVHKFISIIKNNPEMLKKRTAYVLCVDDIADCFWCLKTTLNDLKIKSILDVKE